MEELPWILVTNSNDNQEKNVMPRWKMHNQSEINSLTPEGTNTDQTKNS